MSRRVRLPHDELLACEEPSLDDAEAEREQEAEEREERPEEHPRVGFLLVRRSFAPVRQPQADLASEYEDEIVPAMKSQPGI